MAVGSKHQHNQTYFAGADLSAATAQFTFVRLSATLRDTVVAVTADTDIPIGVLQNSPRLDESAIVTISGFTKLRAGITDLAGVPRVATDATGRAIAIVAGVSTAYFAVGRIVLTLDNADNDGGLVSAVVDCYSPCRNF